MSIAGKIKTLSSDKENTEALFPRTKISAVSDDSGIGLNVLLDAKVSTTEDGMTALFASGVTILSSNQYGSTLPTSGVAGQLFFKKI